MCTHINIASTDVVTLVIFRGENNTLIIGCKKETDRTGLKCHSVWCIPRLTWQVLLGSILVLVHLTNSAVKLIIVRTGGLQSLHEEDSRRGRKGGIEGGD